MVFMRILPSVRKTSRSFAAGMVVALLLGGCSSTPKPQVTFGTVTLDTAPTANNDSATAVDFVVIYDSAITDDLLKLSAADWFARRDQEKADHPGGFQVFSWEVVPGQKVSGPINQSGPGWGAVVYANYGEPGPHRLRVEKSGPVTIGLNTDDIVLRPDAPAGK